MLAQNTFKTALDEYYRRAQKLEDVFSGHSLLNEETLLSIHGSLGAWLQFQDMSLKNRDDELRELQHLHDAYYQALSTLICLYNKNSIDQARSFYEGEFKEQSIKLTASLLRWVNLLNQEELKRHETL